MRYLLLIGGEPVEGVSSKDVCESPEGEAWVADMERRGMFRSGELLRPPSEAATVRVRDGEVLVADGPFAETKEQVGGITVLECGSFDEAVAMAATHPSAKQGTIEVRPIWEP
jgi:hypothetical protein